MSLMYCSCGVGHMPGCEFYLKKTNDYRQRTVDALHLITQYGGIDGAHHKQWVLDQVVRALSDDYDGWVKSYEAGDDGPKTYEWDGGIAP